MANQFNLGSQLVLLNGLPILLPIAATDPAGAVAGDFYYNSTSNTTRYYNGTTWVSDSGGSVTAVSVATANGLAGTSSGGATPALTLSTTLTTPVLAGNGTALIAATTTGTGSTVVLSTSPTLTTPVLGTPTSLTLTNATGLPLTTGVTGLLPLANGGTNAATAAAAFGNLSPLTTTGDLIYEASPGVAARLGVGTAGQVLSVVAGLPAWSAASAGTVTSVALADGSTTPIFAITGSPVTGAGTLTETLLTQTANTVFSGPATGAAAQPGFRSLVVADIPSLSSIYELVSNFSTRTYINSIALAASVSTPTTIPALTFAFATFGSVKLTYEMIEATTGARRFGTFLVTTDGVTAGYNDAYAESAQLGNGIVLSAVVSGANVNIQYTGTGTNAVTLRTEISSFNA